STPAIYPLALHDALPILLKRKAAANVQRSRRFGVPGAIRTPGLPLRRSTTPIIRRNPEASVIAENPRHYWIYRMMHVVSCVPRRSEEHTSELQSRFDLVC